MLNLYLVSTCYQYHHVLKILPSCYILLFYEFKIVLKLIRYDAEPRFSLFRKILDKINTKKLKFSHFRSSLDHFSHIESLENTGIWWQRQTDGFYYCLIWRRQVDLQFYGKTRNKTCVGRSEKKIAFSTEIFVFNKINLCCMN